MIDFRMDGRPPTQDELNAEHRRLIEFAVNAIGTTHGFCGAALLYGTFCAYWGKIIGGAIGAGIFVLLVVIALVSWGYYNHLLRLKALLNPVPASPERIVEAFFLTEDCRRYAADVIRQGRPITMFELKMSEIYAEEFADMMKQLSAEDIRRMADKVGCDLSKGFFPRP